MWNPFKRRAPEPPAEQQPTAPAAPAEPAEKPRGLLGRLGQRLRPGRAKAKPEQKPAAPATPAPAPAGGGGGGGGGEAGGGEAPSESDAQKAARQYPKGLGATVEGVWQISDTEWDGVMTGTLRGDDVVAFLEAMEAGDEAAAVQLVADAYDEAVGRLIDPAASTIHRIDYRH